MKQWLTRERLPLTFIIAATLFILLASVLNGCAVDDWVQVKVPTDVATAIDAGDTIPASETEAAWDEWVAWVDRNSERFAREIDKGNETVTLIASLTDTGIGLASDVSSALPGGAIISTGLGLLGGLFLRRPGDAKKEQQEKEASYNAGLAKGRDLLAQTITKEILERRQAEG